MGCGCGKNKPKVALRNNPTVIAQSTQNFARSPQIQRPNTTVTVQSTGAAPVQVNVNGIPQQVNPAEPPPTTLSPAGLDAHRRKVEALRREAIRRALNR